MQLRVSKSSVPAIQLWLSPSRLRILEGEDPSKDQAMLSPSSWLRTLVLSALPLQSHHPCGYVAVLVVETVHDQPGPCGG